MDRRRLVPITALAAILLAAAFVYLQTLRFWFVFDDRYYILDNPYVRGGFTAAGVRWAFTNFFQGNWHPITWLTHMLDYRLFLMEAGSHHTLNVILHLANIVLLYLVMRRLTGAVWRSLLVAGLFGLHPLHVESVAWISERKDLLSAFFWFLALLAWARYASRPSVGRYLTAALLFALGLMSKPMIITFPFLLLVLDYWPLSRLNRPADLGPLMLEKAPLAALSATSSVITFLAQRSGGAVGSLSDYPFAFRLTNALTAYLRYLVKALLPVNLAAFYPHRYNSVPWLEVVAAAAILLGCSAAAWHGARKGYRWPAAGWCWYIGTLIPVIGLVQVGDQSMADRYTYVPLVGIFVIVSWGLAALAGRSRRRRAAAATLAAALLLACTLQAHHQASFWKDEVTLYQRAIAVVPDNWLAYNGLALALQEQTHYQEALPFYMEALRIYPDYWEAQVNLGILYDVMGRQKEAIAALKEAIRLEPDKPKAYYNLGLVYVNMRDKTAVMDIYRTLLKLDPGSAAALLPFINYLP